MVTTNITVTPEVNPPGYTFRGSIEWRGKPPIRLYLFVPEQVVAAMRMQALHIVQQWRNYLAAQNLRIMPAAAAQFGCSVNAFGCVGPRDEFGGFLDEVVDVVHTVASNDIIKSIPYVGTAATLIAAGTGLYQQYRGTVSEAGTRAAVSAKAQGADPSQVVEAARRASEEMAAALTAQLKSATLQSSQWKKLYLSARKAQKVDDTYRGRRVDPSTLIHSNDPGAMETAGYLFTLGKSVRAEYPTDRPLATGELEYTFASGIADPAANWGT